MIFFNVLNQPELMKHVKGILGIALIIFLSFNISKTQDLHYTQFYNSPLNISAANTGLFNGDQRLNFSIRDQGRSVPVPWFTLSGAFDKKFYPKYSEKYFFSGGLNFNYDQQGDARLNLSNLNLSLSYSRVINKNNILTIGVLGGFSTRGFDTETNTWDMQWVGDRVDLNLSSGENFDNNRVSFLETGAGLNYRWQKDTRTKVDIGGAVFHILEPEANFQQGDQTKLPMRIDINAVANIQVFKSLDIQLHGLQQFQNVYEELVFGGLVKIYVNQQRGKETEVHIGASYRTSKFLAPTLAFRYKDFYVGASYDMDMTPFNLNQSNLGGPEVHVRYIITNVKPLKLFKVCPIF